MTSAVLQVMVIYNDVLEKAIYVFLWERVFCVDEKVNCDEMENAFYVAQEMVIYNLSGIWIFALNKKIPYEEEIALANTYEVK